MRLSLIPALALLLLTPTISTAAVFQITLDFTPSGDFGTSTDPADGNQIVVTWETSLTNGVVSQFDLTNLSFSMFGNGTLVYRDDAIVNSAAMPLAGIGRTISDISFFFSLDDFATDPKTAPLGFNNDFQKGFGFGSDDGTEDKDKDKDKGKSKDEGTGDVTYHISGVFNSLVLSDSVNAIRFVSESEERSRSVTSSPITSVQTIELSSPVSAVPLPAALPLMLSGLAAFGVVRLARRRRTGLVEPSA